MISGERFFGLLTTAGVTVLLEHFELYIIVKAAQNLESFKAHNSGVDPGEDHRGQMSPLLNHT